MTEEMEMSRVYEEADDYEEYGEEAEARIEPFRRRRKPYRHFSILLKVIPIDNIEQEEKEAKADFKPGLLQRRLH